MAKWRVEIFRKRLLQLGTISAPNAQEALSQAVNLFQIDREDKAAITKLDTPKPKRMHTSARYPLG
jgi:hypothetical protein